MKQVSQYPLKHRELLLAAADYCVEFKTGGNINPVLRKRLQGAIEGRPA